ncbi:MAG: hypothetical protein ABI824_19575 [Acidobacteriota bacterium]
MILATSVGAVDLPLGQALPPLKGEYLTGRKAILPEASSGRVALLALGFTYKSRYAVEAWGKWFDENYGKDARVTFYEIPMIGGLATLGKWFIDSGMRRGTPKSAHEHVITVYGGIGPWKERLAYKDTDSAYLIVLDKQGIVRWRYSGAFDGATSKKLSAQMDALLANP